VSLWLVIAFTQKAQSAAAILKFFLCAFAGKNSAVYLEDNSATISLTAALASSTSSGLNETAPTTA
jgi:hypothetical protein